MKRQIINSYGSPDVFQMEEFLIYEPEEGEILVENKYSSVNPVDLDIRQGNMDLLTGKKFPMTLGLDFSGTVAKSRNTAFPEGAEIYGCFDMKKGGAYSTHFTTDGKNCAPKPSHLSFEEAGVIGVTGLTAFQIIEKHGQVKQGDKVFVNGCTGGVGSLLVKMAKALGAEVTGTCDPINNDMAVLLGCDRTLDYNKPERLEDHLKMYDLVVDTSGVMDYDMYDRLGKKGAKFCTTSFEPKLVMRSWVSKKLLYPDISYNTKNLELLKLFLENYDIHPVIDHTYPLGEIKKAHEAMKERSVLGNLAIRMK